LLIAAHASISDHKGSTRMRHPFIWTVLALLNGVRLSCGNTLKGSQTQFYHRRRAPSDPP